MSLVRTPKLEMQLGCITPHSYLYASVRYAFGIFCLPLGFAGWAVAFDVRDAVGFFSGPVLLDREHLLGRLRRLPVGRHLVSSRASRL